MISSVSDPFFVLLITPTAHTAKATDENLTGEDWETVLNLCDKVQDEGEAGFASTDSILLFTSADPLPQCTQHDRSIAQTSCTPLPKCAAVCALPRRVSLEELRDRSPSRACVTRIHPGSRATGYRQGGCAGHACTEHGLSD